MIPKPLAEITESDLLGLITNGIAESRTLDYKRSLPGNSDADKKEFLADVSSFANTAGGDLVFGIDED
jgi:predicted HTH transcriptional regulator